MTAVLLAAAAFTAGATITALTAWDIYRRADERHDWTTRWLHETDIRAIATAADHDHRLANRWQGALHALEHVHHEVVGDLLDKVAERDRTIAQLTPQQPWSPVPVYGIWAA